MYLLISTDILQTDGKCLVESGTGGVNNEKYRYPSCDGILFCGS
jgi:hypothetical protein